MNDSISEKLCMCFIHWCENHSALNSHCGLSTIEYIRQAKPDKALKYINEVMDNWIPKQKRWKMPTHGDKKLHFE